MISFTTKQVQSYLESKGLHLQINGDLADLTSEAPNHKLGASLRVFRRLCKDLLLSAQPWLKLCHEVFYLWKFRHFHNSIFEGKFLNLSLDKSYFFLESGDRLALAVQINLIRSLPGFAAQSWHQDEPVNEGCPSRLHLCVPCCPLNETNGIEYRFANGSTSFLTAEAGETCLHTSDIFHRGVANTSRDSRVNCFITVQPKILRVDFVV